jgi:hypothetical protein
MLMFARASVTVRPSVIISGSLTGTAMSSECWGSSSAGATCFVRNRSSHVVHMRQMPATRDSVAEVRDFAWLEELHNAGERVRVGIENEGGKAKRSGAPVVRRG